MISHDIAAAAREAKHILQEDVEATLAYGKSSGSYFVDEESGHHLTSWRPRKVTFWVEYTEQEDGSFLVYDAWCHRMIVPGRCHVPLEQIAVNTVYSHGGMQLRLPRCPVCGQTMIPKYVAEGPFKVIEKGIEETWNSVDQRPREH